MTELFYPSGLFIPGTNTRTNVHHWELRSGRVLVQYLDGQRTRSELTPAELERMPGVLRCTCGEYAANRDCPTHGDGN